MPNYSIDLGLISNLRPCLSAFHDEHAYPSE